jgi:hypothetical protein
VVVLAESTRHVLASQGRGVLGVSGEVVRVRKRPYRMWEPGDRFTRRFRSSSNDAICYCGLWNMMIVAAASSR